MRTTLLIICTLVFTATATAKPNLLSVPREVGRTARNMTTFHDKAAALEEWGNLGVTLADFIVSENVLRRDPAVQEVNPIFGRHPSMGRYIAIGTPFGMYGAVVTQYLHEQTDGTDKHYWTYLPAGVDGAIHGAAIAWNEHEFRVTCKQVGIVCQ